MSHDDLIWLAGLLEGEGSFIAAPPSSPGQPKVTVQMTDEEIIQKVSRLWSRAALACRPQKAHHKASYKTTIAGAPAAELMRMIRPYMGSRRQAQIDSALLSAKSMLKITGSQAEEIVRRRHAGEDARALAGEYGISHWYVYMLARNGWGSRVQGRAS